MVRHLKQADSDNKFAIRGAFGEDHVGFLPTMALSRLVIVVLQLAALAATSQVSLPANIEIDVIVSQSLVALPATRFHQQLPQR